MLCSAAKAWRSVHNTAPPTPGARSAEALTLASVRLNLYATVRRHAGCGVVVTDGVADGEGGGEGGVVADGDRLAGGGDVVGVVVADASILLDQDALPLALAVALVV